MTTSIDTGWAPHNNGGGPRRWFLYREDVRAYRMSRAGVLVRYASYDTAARAAARLNAAESVAGRQGEG